MTIHRRALFFIDPLATLDPHKDSSLAMMHTAQKNGYTIWISGIDHIYYGQTVKTHAYSWQDPTETCTDPLSEYAFVMMRKDPPVDQRYIYATHLLSRAQKEGALVLNDPHFLRSHHEKLSILDFPEDIPDTVVTANHDAIIDCLDEHKEIIIKPLHGMGGEGVFYIRIGDPNRDSIIETLTANGTKPIMVQRYLSAVQAGDKRIFIINGHVYPVAVLRIPQPHHVRANLAQGGTAHICGLTPKEAHIAQKVADRITHPHIMLLGLDMIGEYLTEINATSPTCLVPIEKNTHYKPTQDIMNAIDLLLS